MKSRVMKAIGLTAALVSCIGMTVFAGPSPEASTVVTGVEEATDKSGNKVQIEVTAEIPEESKEAVADIKSEETLKEVLDEKFNENLTVADVKEVTAPEGTEFPVDITFTMKGVTKDTKVMILHYAEEKGWEEIPTTVGDGTVTGTFESLSPVAFVVDKTTMSAGAVSPATNASAVSAVAVIGLVAAVAAFGLKRKSVVR